MGTFGVAGLLAGLPRQNMTICCGFQDAGLAGIHFRSLAGKGQINLAGAEMRMPAKGC
jgi:hypothetical protein